MKIAIIGTRGIPNQYGGFEQFVEYISPLLVKKGHEITVYNSSLHPYTEPEWNGVKIIRKKDPENHLGTIGQFIYDYNCIMDSRKRDFDIILQLGYTSSSIWSFLFPKSKLLVTNMDGLEWKRTKYSYLTRKFLQRAEKWAVKYSDKLIADSKGIQEYLKNKYGKESHFIAYGATPFLSHNYSLLKRNDLEEGSYNLLIARMEPENNIETILKGHMLSGKLKKLILIGNDNTKYGSYLKNKYSDSSIFFYGPCYDITLLNNLRYFSHLYFHGHTVGGTNPSLLEAMSSGALIVAHNNIFNKSVLGENAFYFTNEKEVSDILNKKFGKTQYSKYINNNLNVIANEYSWDFIANEVEKYLSDSL